MVPARRCLSVLCVPASSYSTGSCPGQRATSSCLTRVTRTARSTWNPGSLKSSARASRRSVFLRWPSVGSSCLRPGPLRAGTLPRRGVGSGRVPPRKLKACLKPAVFRFPRRDFPGCSDISDPALPSLLLPARSTPFPPGTVASSAATGPVSSPWLRGSRVQRIGSLVFG